MNILIIGSSGKIGSFLKEKLNKDHKLYLINKNNINKKINSKLDLVINCIGSNIYKNKLKIYKIFDIFSKNNLRSEKFKWIEISTVSIYGLTNETNIKNNHKIKSNQLSKYGLNKLNAEDLIINLANKRKFNINIYRFGIVIERKNLDQKIKDIFKRFVYKKVFFNFFKKKTKLKISYLDTIYQILDKDLKSYDKKNFISTYFEEINILPVIKELFNIVFIININLNFFLGFFKIFNYDFFIKLKLLFNNNISENDHSKIKTTYIF